MKTLTIIALLLSTFGVVARARPISQLDLQSLTHDADQIVVGRITDERDLGEITINFSDQQLTVHRISARLASTRVIKGNAAAWFYVEFFKDRWASFKPVPVNDFGMFFFKRGAANTLQPVDRDYPSLQALPTPPTFKEEVFDKVVAELLNVVIYSADHKQRSEAIEAIQYAKSDEASEVMKKLATGFDPNLKLQALTILVRQGDTPSVKAAIEILLHPSPMYEKWRFAMLSVSIRLAHDPLLVKDVGRLIDAPEVLTRQFAANALRDTKSADALPYLVRALKDPSRDVRYQAVMGLAEFTMDYQWAPATDVYSKDETRYLNHWRKWASNP